jgi:hypothetical protein
MWSLVISSLLVLPRLTFCQSGVSRCARGVVSRRLCHSSLLSTGECTLCGSRRFADVGPVEYPLPPTTRPGGIWNGARA